MDLELGLGLTKYIPPLLYAVSFIVMGLTLFKRKDIGIYFIVFFLPIPNFLEWAENYPLGKDINDMLLIILTIRWFIDSRLNGEPFFKKTPFNFPFFLLIIWTVIEFYHGANYMHKPIVISASDSRFMALKNFFVIPLLFFIIVNNIKNLKQIKIILVMMLLAIIALDRNSYNIMRYQDLSHYADNLKVIGEASALSGNSLAVFFAQYTIVLLAVAWCIKNIRIKILLSFPITISYYCTLFLFSRSGYLAVALSFLYWGIVKSRTLLVLMILGIFSYQILLPTAVKERIEMTKTEDGFDNTTQQRLEMWELAKNIILQNPVLGAGFNFTQDYNIQLDNSDHVWHSFHNSFIQQIVETGFIGLALYLWLFFKAIKMGWKLYRKTEDDFFQGLGLGMIGAVIACMGGNVGGSYWNMLNAMGFLWVLTAIVTRIVINIEEQEQESETEIPFRELAFSYSGQKEGEFVNESFYHNNYSSSK